MHLDDLGTLKLNTSDAHIVINVLKTKYMKSIQKLLGIIFILILFSCSKDENLIQKSDPQNNTEITTRNNQTNTAYNIPIYSQTELIVKYPAGTTEVVKQSMRSHYEVLYYETCQLCPDGAIEKWTFDSNIQIEPKKHSIETDGILPYVDYEFIFETEIDGIEVGSWEDTSYEPLIVSENSKVTVAIIDTGFDPFFPAWYEDGEPIPMLYKASDPGGDGVLSGWDFVNDNNNPFDDDLGKHGSILTYEIHNILRGTKIPYQILPVKAFDANGNASYFDIICSTYWAAQRANIIQMSFGWYEPDIDDLKSTIFKNLLEIFHDVLFVTSAGNNGENNDFNPHFPSGYDLDNIVGIAATNKNATLAATWSNFGLYSVDFWAVGEEVPFYNYDGEPIEGGVEGTSFAAPQIAALAAIQKFYGASDISPAEIINLINISGLETPVEFGNLVKYDKYFPLMVE